MTSIGQAPATGRMTSADPTPRALWKRWRGLILVAVLIVGLGAATALLSGGSTGGVMDPRSTGQHGARALAELLERQGVQITTVDVLEDALEAGAGADTALLITVPDLLSEGVLFRVYEEGPKHLVLFEPGDVVLESLTSQVFRAGSAYEDVRKPGCDLPAARLAGTIRTDGAMYRATGKSGATRCYGDDDRSAIVRTIEEDHTIDIIGTPSSFQNQHLAEEGNAALALNLLGAKPHLVWYVPDLTDPAIAPGGERASLFDLLPAGARAGLGMLAVAALFGLLVAIRRLGPVVPEKLPVVVRASETTEGRARLYRRMRAREQAAAGLRAVTRTRLAQALGLPPDGPIEELRAAASFRTKKSASEVAAALDDQPIADDAALVRLASELDRIEQEVNRT